ncbi:SPOR domain-containing protein [Pleionea litopenaei]|uniref:SPOR domain-containing protein n=1 Tax=Pleionea litopenaei TaxID=3070815 RepID=A0AA51RUH2_9GAMM|nr:SPOR domain-containing protein [Pleionea sp. HL-JVS1]WMS87704.1 SPOR domain-containing protein [Pleionea sp. HL-JVS1]
MSVDQTIKQRLIGAIVLVAIAVVFLPGILGQKKTKGAFETAIPDNRGVVELNSSKESNGANTPSAANDSSKPKVTSPESQTTTRSNPQSTAQKSSNKPSEIKNDSTDASESANKNPKSSSSREATADKSTTQSDATNSQSQQQAKTNTSTPAKRETPKEKANITELKESSWVVQVGSFSSHSNAELLAKRLEEQQLKSFVRPVELAKDKILYRVYVGPWLKKEQAQQNVAKIADITRLKPIVTSWEPTKQ